MVGVMSIRTPVTRICEPNSIPHFGACADVFQLQVETARGDALYS